MEPRISRVIGAGLGPAQNVDQFGQPLLLINAFPHVQIKLSDGEAEDGAGTQIEPAPDLLANKIAKGSNEKHAERLTRAQAQAVIGCRRW